MLRQNSLSLKSRFIDSKNLKGRKFEVKSSKFKVVVGLFERKIRYGEIQI